MGPANLFVSGWKPYGHGRAEREMAAAHPLPTPHKRGPAAPERQPILLYHCSVFQDVQRCEWTACPISTDPNLIKAGIELVNIALAWRSAASVSLSCAGPCILGATDTANHKHS